MTSPSSSCAWGMRYTFSKNQVLESKLMHPKDLSNGLPYIASIEKSLARRARYSNATNDSHLMDIKEQQVDLSQAFLDCIESVNAARLSRLCINSPSSEESLQSLRLRQDHCKNLRCLKLVVHRKNVKFFDQPDDFERNYTRWTQGSKPLRNWTKLSFNSTVGVQALRPRMTCGDSDGRSCSVIQLKSTELRSS
jgi:hypothetical protein